MAQAAPIVVDVQHPRICDECGTLVGDREAHEAFHRRIDRIDQDSRLDGRR